MFTEKPLVSEKIRQSIVGAHQGRRYYRLCLAQHGGGKKTCDRAICSEYPKEQTKPGSPGVNFLLNLW